MRARLFALPLACLGALGCSALSDFDGYEFSAGDRDAGQDSGVSPSAGSGSMDPDGGAAGSAGGSGSSSAGMGGDDGGSGSGAPDGGGSGGDSGSGSSGTGGDGGDGGAGSGGTGGTGTEPECTQDGDCQNDETCVNEMCVPVRLPSGTSHTGGGGTVTSTGYTLRVSIGVPGPMGSMSSTNYAITLGPAAGRN